MLQQSQVNNDTLNIGISIPSAIPSAAAPPAIATQTATVAPSAAAPPPPHLGTRLHNHTHIGVNRNRLSRQPFSASPASVSSSPQTAHPVSFYNPPSMLSSSSALSNDLLKYSYSYPTTANPPSSSSSSGSSTQTTKLPSISTLLSASSNLSNSPSPSMSVSTSPTSLGSKNPFMVSPPILRHNPSFSNNSRSESFSSIESSNYSRSNSLLFNPLSNSSLNTITNPASAANPSSTSLETLTSVAQQSFGNSSFQVPKNSFSNSQYISNHSNYLDYSIPKYQQHQKYSLSYSQTSEDNEVEGKYTIHSSPSSPSSLSTSAPATSSSESLMIGSDSPSSSLSSSSPSSSSSISLNGKSKKKRSNLPKQSTSILLSWLNNNLDHPYPNSKEKIDLMRKTGLSAQQLSNWFINARRRKIQVLRDVKPK